jgi:hypothetical protein
MPWRNLWLCIGRNTIFSPTTYHKNSGGGGGGSVTVRQEHNKPRVCCRLWSWKCAAADAAVVCCSHRFSYAQCRQPSSHLPPRGHALLPATTKLSNWLTFTAAAPLVMRSMMGPSQLSGAQQLLKPPPLPPPPRACAHQPLHAMQLSPAPLPTCHRAV